MSAWNAALLVLWVVVLFNLLLTYTLIRRVGSGAGQVPVGGLDSGALPAGTTTLLAPRASNPLLDSFRVSAYPSYTVVRADGTVDGTYGHVRQVEARLARL